MYRTLSKGHDFEYAHCWPILKDTKKFGDPPSMNFDTTSSPSPINLEDDDSPQALHLRMHAPQAKKLKGLIQRRPTKMIHLSS